MSRYVEITDHPVKQSMLDLVAKFDVVSGSRDETDHYSINQVGVSKEQLPRVLDDISEVIWRTFENLAKALTKDKEGKVGIVKVSPPLNFYWAEKEINFLSPFLYYKESEDGTYDVKGEMNFSIEGYGGKNNAVT